MGAWETLQAEAAVAGAYASERYRPAIAAHQPRYDYEADVFGTECRCGYPGVGRHPRRSVGLHVAAAKKRADKQWDADFAEKLAELREKKQ
jgi:hypothetical protein